MKEQRWKVVHYWQRPFDLERGRLPVHQVVSATYGSLKGLCSIRSSSVLRTLPRQMPFDHNADILDIDYWK